MCIEDNRKKLLVSLKELVRNQFLKITLKKRLSRWPNPVYLHKNNLIENSYMLIMWRISLCSFLLFTLLFESLAVAKNITHLYFQNAADAPSSIILKTWN